MLSFQCPVVHVNVDGKTVNYKCGRGKSILIICHHLQKKDDIMCIFSESGFQSSYSWRCLPVKTRQCNSSKKVE